MKIGILSDTHGYFHPAFREVFSGVDYIFHAGDIGLMPVYKQLEEIAPVVAVRGNIDGEEFFDLPKLEHRTVDGIHFSLIHNAGDIYHPSFDMHTRILSETTDILISGHYHGYWCTPIKRSEHPVLWLSPGAAGNAGHHHDRTALLLTLHSPKERTGDIFHDVELEKINLGPRSFAC